MSENIFYFKNYFISTGTSAKNKLDDSIPVTYQEPVLEMQTNLMTVYR